MVPIARARDRQRPATHERPEPQDVLERDASLDPTSRTPSAVSPPRAWRTVAGWSAAGLVWGIAARAWMRLVSTAPEFSWTGTLFILQVATVAGLLVGVARALRARGHARAAAVLGSLAVLPISAGQGAVLAPGIVFGAVAARGPLPRRPIRILLALLAGLAAMAFFGASPIVAAAVAAVPLVAGRWLRPAAVTLALGAHVGVVWSFAPGLPLPRAAAGVLAYVLLLAAATAGYVHAVRDEASAHQHRGDLGPVA